MERLSNTQELLDGPLEPEVLAGNLRDLRRINRWLGGPELSWRAVATLVAELPRDLRPRERRQGDSHARGASDPRPISLLDVGTGAADIPCALLRRAGQAGHALSITAVEVRDEIVEFARQATAGIPELVVVRGGPDRLDFDDRSFDIVHASLVAHHLEPDALVGLLAEMARVCRHAVIVNDLDRRRHWWLAAWLLSRLTSANRYTRHDAPMSVRRAYRPAELAVLAERAGLRATRRLDGLLGHRYALVLAPVPTAR